MTQDNGAENSTMQSPVFRTAEIPAPAEEAPSSIRTEESQSNESIEVEPEFSIYEKVNHRPYTADYFELGEKFKNLSRLDKESLAEMEEIFRQTIKSKFLKDDKEVVRNLISGIEKKLGLNKLNDPYYRMDKIVKYLKVMGTDI